MREDSIEAKRIVLLDEEGHESVTLTGESLKEISQQVRYQSTEFLDKLYDHSKQLVTLNTGIAGLFVAFANHLTGWLVASLLFIGAGGVIAVVMLTCVTRKIGRGEIYTLPSGSLSDWRRPLFWIHLLSILALIVRIGLFCINKLQISA
jgi:hypothetical protein